MSFVHDLSLGLVFEPYIKGVHELQIVYADE
jgi:hypothetical protein